MAESIESTERQAVMMLEKEQIQEAVWLWVLKYYPQYSNTKFFMDLDIQAKDWDSVKIHLWKKQ